MFTTHTRTASLLFSGLIVFFSLASGQAGASLRYEGSLPIGENIIVPAAGTFKEKTGIAFASISHQGSETAVAAVLEERADIGGLARPVKAEEITLKLRIHLIGFESIGVFVHPRNPVVSLSMQQLADIFSGKTTNWREVGGQDLPVTVVVNDSAGRSLSQSFYPKVLAQTPLGKKAVRTRQPQAHLSMVAKNKGAITFDSLALKSGNIKILALDGVMPSTAALRKDHYPLSRPLHLVTQGLPSGEVLQFIKFMLSAEGQAIVKQNFLPVYE
ncbi:phosphate ABC transporter substrate-binding protein [candidate division FCPU426 bacterium]|nr:phosphate ABC transporter substrate-binding protein [candidate division FCPU426 bacterium]